MKKILFYVCALMAAGVAGAQTPGGVAGIIDTDYYTHPLDYGLFETQCTVTTSVLFDDNAISSGYNGMSDRDLFGDVLCYRVIQYGNGIMGRQMATDRILKVVGVAAPVHVDRGQWMYCSGHRFFSVNDTLLASRNTEWMGIYEFTPEGLSLLGSGKYRIEDPHRIVVFPRGNLDNHYNEPEIQQSYDTVSVPLYEVEFKDPVYVEDSFVVGGAMLNNEGRWRNSEGWPSFEYWSFDHSPTRYLAYIYRLDSCSLTEYINTRMDLRHWNKYRNQTWVSWWCDEYWFRGHEDFNTLPTERLVRVPMFWPIIEPGFDTTICHEVRNLRVEERGVGTATVMWDSGDGGPWEVAVGKMTDAWSDYVVTTVTAPTLTLTGLETGVQYFALVRGYCSVTEDYGEWSRPLEVEVYHNVPDTTGQREGIDLAEDGDDYVSMVPNPAVTVTNVMSSYRMERIEAYDSRGVRVLEQKADGVTATLDVGGWPSGVYVIAIYCKHGVKTKRLVVR